MNASITLTGIIRVVRETMPFSLIGSVADGICLQHATHSEFIGQSISTSEVLAEKVLNSKTKLVKTRNSVYLIICD